MNSIYKMKRKLNIRIAAALVLYSAGCFFVAVIVQSIFVDSGNLLLLWLRERWDIILFLILVTGFFAICFHYCQKPWNYLDEIISATNSVYKSDSENIVLSEPLREIESQMNHIKMAALTSNQAVMQAEKKSNELIMYLAHDIRTPLTTVIGYLSLLHEVPEMPQEQKEKYVSIALEKSEHLDVLINELFEITRFKTQSIVINKSSVDINCLLTQLVDEFYPIFSKNNNTLTLDLKEPLSVYADSEKIVRVFANLLKNAASYSDSGTDITVAANIEEGFLTVRIQNESATIPEDELETLFDQFSRVDKSRASHTGAAGLGLAIAKEIVVLHGGSIVAESKNNSFEVIVKIPLSN